MPTEQADFETARDILESVGIPVLGRCARGRAEALALAEEIGFPVAMKLSSPDVVHKTDVGVLMLDVDCPRAAAQAYDAILRNAEQAGAKRIAGVVVQKQVKAGFELFIGAKQDPVFGPVTLVGYGGRNVELFKDVAPGVGSLTAEDADRMLSSTMAGRVVEGFRGPRLDRAAAIDLTVRVSRLMEERPDVHELDLNPVILYPRGFAVVDVRVVLGEPVSHPRAEHLSEARLASLRALFEARSVAVVGASRPGTIGGIILKNSSALPRLYPVNPKYDSLLGRPCYARLADLPEPAEVAVFAVPPEATIEGFRAFCRSGGKAAIVVSDGFAEVGRSDLEQRLRAVGEEHGAVYIGPNCLGVFDNFSQLNTLFLPLRRTNVSTRPGHLGVISQSGGVGVELLEMLAADDVGIGKWVSCGNASGVSIPELLQHMGDDARIHVVAVYLEGLRNGLQFMEVGREVARKKPVIVIKGGVGGGAAATMSHTASLAGSHEAFRAACRQAGLFLIEELTEDPKVLVNVLSILTTHRRARGDRVAVVSVGGGAAILLADQITARGMRLAQFSAATRGRLLELLGCKLRLASEQERARFAERVAGNPLDLFGDADDERFLRALRILDEDENTDVVLAALYFQVPYLSEYLAERLVELRRELHKPLILSTRGFSDHVARTREFLTRNDVHTYTVPMILPLRIALDVWRRYDIDFTGAGPEPAVSS